MNDNRRGILFFATLLGFCAPLFAADPPVPPPGERPPFAVVDGVAIPAERFISSVQQGARQKFYHGKIPEADMAKFQREMGTALVDRLLLVKEAKRQGLQPDQSEIQKEIAGYDQRYGNSPRYQANREAMLTPLVEEMADRSLVTQLQERITRGSEPTEKELRDYYDANPDKFTEPEDMEISLILLKVDPSAGQDAWDKAKTEADALMGKLKAGGDFAELARIHSGDISAAKGGKMDYLHSGMLAEGAEKAIAQIQPGQFTDPILVLEGYAIFRLDQRTPPHKLAFDAARPRVKKLFQRDSSESAWKTFREGLWKKAAVSINESYYLPLPEPGQEAEGSARPHSLGGAPSK
ncbi:MAG: peptidyl-prolyl cis-trans isomerase [Magnetococcales bacterium]|nr:peptidyl-prolyl cis-trans isomerase [Magnetococcales bacterium]